MQRTRYSRGTTSVYRYAALTDTDMSIRCNGRYRHPLLFAVRVFGNAARKGIQADPLYRLAPSADSL